MQNPRDFWAEIRRHRTKKRVMNCIENEDWLKHFEGVFNEGVDINVEEAVCLTADSVFNDILDAEITEAEIRKAIKHLKTGKAAGPDSILAEIIKTVENEMLPFLKKYSNYLFSKGHFPLQWSKATIFLLLLLRS